jgi:hypothetical protein
LEEVQFIARCPTFLKREQEERNIKPHRSVHDANLDWITFKNGDLTVTREGQFEVLYDFLMEGTSQNIDNPNRIETADEVFRVIKLNKTAEEYLDFDELQDEAKRKVRSWREKVNGEWIYNSEKISIACEVFGVLGDTDQQRLQILMRRASDLPKDFLEKLGKMEQTTITQINQAIQLRVIEFIGNAAAYVEAVTGKKTMIYSVGSGKLNTQAKIEKLSDWFRTEEGRGAYEIFRTELDAEKEKQLATN